MSKQHNLKSCATQTGSNAVAIRRKVREGGLEPPRVSPLPPQSSASTNSATPAGIQEEEKSIVHVEGYPCKYSMVFLLKNRIKFGYGRKNNFSIFDF